MALLWSNLRIGLEPTGLPAVDRNVARIHEALVTALDTPWLDVRRFGATGRGSVDDGIYWNKARDGTQTAVATGGVVLVPPGAYKLTTAFSFGAATNVLLWILPGVTLSGSALPTPAGTNAILDLRGGAFTYSGPVTFSGALTVSGLLAAQAGLTVSSGPIRQSYGTDPGSNTTEAIFLSNRWRFPVLTGDEANAGTIAYRLFDGTALELVGAGTVAPNRLVRVWDKMGIGMAASTSYSLSLASGLSLTGGSIAAPGIAATVGALTVSGGVAVIGTDPGALTAELLRVGGDVRFGAAPINQAHLGGFTLLGNNGGAGGEYDLAANAYYSSGWKYYSAQVAAVLQIDDGATGLIYATAAAGAAPGNPVTFTTRAYITRAGLARFMGGLEIMGGSISASGIAATVGSLTWPAVSGARALSNVDASGLFIEYIGSTTANEKLRLQTSKAGDQANYLQLMLDPTNGASFVAIGSGSNAVSMGPLTATNAAGAVAALRYDASNRLDITISSAGAVLYTAVGASAGHSFGSQSVGMGPLTTTTVKATGLGAYAAGDHYVVADASGNFHLSSLGPGS